MHQPVARPNVVSLTQAACKQAVRLGLLWLMVSGLLSGARLTHPAFGLQGDLPLHYHITRAFARSLGEGELLPRWAGLLDGGRGDALFTFYPPLCYLLNAVLMRLFGIDALTALKLVSLFIFFIAQASAYLLARHFFTQRQSLLVALSYVLLPAYPLLALHRAFVANALALSLVPLMLLGAYLLLSGERRARAWLLFSLSLSAIILTHAITTYLCVIAVGLLTLIHLPQTNWRNVGRLIAASILALALTAFFWWPQQIERQRVQLNLQLVKQDYRTYFLFAASPDQSRYRQSWAGLNTVTSLITLAQTGTALLLGLLCWRQLSPAVRTQHRTLVWFALTMAALGLFIALPISEPAWRYLPGLQFVQFPWRFQPFVALGCGLLAAVAWEEWSTLGRGRVLLTAGLSWLIIANLIFAFMVARLREPTLTRAHVAATLNATALPPITNEDSHRLQDEDALKYLAYTANQIYFRPQGGDLNLYPPTAQPGGLTILEGQGHAVTQLLHNAQREFLIAAETPLRARIETYSYPHWVARLNGSEIAINTEPNSGLMLLDLPVGSHKLTLTYEVNSFSERVARWISIATCLLLAAGVLKRRIG